MATAVAAAILPSSIFCQKTVQFSSLNNQFIGSVSKKIKFDEKSVSKRRDSGGLVMASANVGTSGAGRFYINFTGFPFPLGPFLNRRTIRTEALKDCIWLFEQEQALGFSSVSTNIRMTVIRLKSGGLWIHAPVAPTKECIQLLEELKAPVEYIVLPTFAYEHKIFVGPFSRKFPKAQVWVAPRQWSWPLNLPLEFFGIFRAKTLRDEDESSPWANEIEQKILSLAEVGIGPYVEVAFYHRRSRTLIVTDAVIFVPRQPPDCISKESLLKSAKNGLAVKILSKGKEVPDEPVVDNSSNRQKVRHATCKSFPGHGGTTIIQNFYSLKWFTASLCLLDRLRCHHLHRSLLISCPHYYHLLLPTLVLSFDLTHAGPITLPDLAQVEAFALSLTRRMLTAA